MKVDIRQSLSGITETGSTYHVQIPLSTNFFEEDHEVELVGEEQDRDAE